MSMPGKRRRRMRTMSRTAAPVGDVTTPMRPGSSGSVFLRSRVEIAFFPVDFLEFFQGGENVADALQAHVAGDDLHLAAQPGRPKGLPLTMICWPFSSLLQGAFQQVAAEHGHLHGPGAVLQGEVEVARTGQDHARGFAQHLDGGELAFQRQLEQLGQLRNFENLFFVLVAFVDYTAFSRSLQNPGKSVFSPCLIIAHRAAIGNPNRAKNPRLENALLRAGLTSAPDKKSPAGKGNRSGSG